MARFSVVVAVAVAVSVLAPARSIAQDCPPELDQQALFEVTIRHYDADWFTPGGYNFVDYGPSLGSLTANRTLPAFPKFQETQVTVESLAAGSLSFSISNATEVEAKRVDGHHFGNGGRIVVDAYVKGPSGTPYYVSRILDGSVEATFPQGLGRSDAQFNGAYASSVNGAGLTNALVGGATLTTGSSGTVRDFNGVTYSHAGRYEFDLSGVIFQSIDFCLPFSPCPTLHYFARGSVSGSMEVGIGHPPCSGTIDQDWCTDCAPHSAGNGVERRFAVSVDMTPATGSTSCSCCEYRQYIRRASSEWTLRFLGLSITRPWPLPPNAAGHAKHCDTWAEDTVGSKAYGYRQPQPLVAKPYSAYVDVDRTPAQICSSKLTVGVADGCHFESLDTPGFRAAPLLGTRKHLEFEGVLVSKASCTPGATRDVVLARKRWTMCCENDGSGNVTNCAEGAPPQFPPLVFSQERPIGPRTAQLMFAEVNGRIVAFAIVNVTRQLPLGYGAVNLQVPGVTALHCDDGPFEDSMWDGETVYAYFPFLLSAPVGGTVTATIDIFGEQASWQVDLSQLGGPVGYCTAGTSTHGCAAVMSAVGVPALAAPGGFQLVCSSVEGQKAGLIFYGISGRTLLPWKPGSTSFLCVKLPTQRMTVANSGGTPSACDGLFATDWLSFLNANPGSLGQPFQAGAVCDAQSWYRDPLAPGATNLSSAVEWTLQP